MKVWNGIHFLTVANIIIFKKSFKIIYSVVSYYDEFRIRMFFFYQLIELENFVNFYESDLTHRPSTK